MGNHKRFGSYIGDMRYFKLSVVMVVTASLLGVAVAYAAGSLGQPASTHPVADTISDLSSKERATEKGEAIAALGSIAKVQRGDYFIEIQNMESIEGGVQIFVRAWDKNNQPIGFGADGTVDIERFRFFNPPILIPDADGNVVREWTNRETGEVKQQRFTENLQEALLQATAHTIKVKKEKFNGSKIIPGKIGNTTDTFYPDAGTGGTTVDGYLRRGISFESWANMHDSAYGGDCYCATGQVFTAGELMTSSSAGTPWRALARSVITFDTSRIPDAAEISAATLSLRIDSHSEPDAGITNDLAIVSANPYYNNSLIGNDYDYTRFGTTAKAAVLANANMVDGSYNDFALTDLSDITKTGITKYGMRNYTHDVLNSAPSWVSPGMHQTYTNVSGADTAGTTNDPKLVVEHSSTGPTSLQMNPSFSALYNPASTTALATYYELQIATSTTWTNPLVWDSGKQALSSSTPNGQRTPYISSTSTWTGGQTYYWRMKFWNQMGGVDLWSTTTVSFVVSN